VGGHRYPRQQEGLDAARCLHFHPLAIEEAVNPDSRVKLEEYDLYVLLIVRTVAFCETTDDPYDLDTANISFFLGKNYLVTVHGADTNPVDSTRELLKRKPELANHGPAKLMHGIVDQAVDAYFPIIDKLDEFMDGLEEKIFAQFDQDVLREVFAVKRLVLSLRRHLAPERDAMSILTNRPALSSPRIPRSISGISTTTFCGSTTPSKIFGIFSAARRRAI